MFRGHFNKNMNFLGVVLVVALVAAAGAMSPGNQVGNKLSDKRCSVDADCKIFMGSTLCGTCNTYFNRCYDCRECSSDLECQWKFYDSNINCSCEGGWCIGCAPLSQ